MARIGRRIGVALACVALLGCGKDEPEGTPTGGTGGASGGSPAAGYGFAKNLGDDLDRTVGEALAKGAKFLKSKRDAESGAFAKGKPVEVGMTAMGTLSLIAATPAKDVATDPEILKGLERVASAQSPDGSIHSGGSLVNYETAAAVSAFAHARVARFKDAQTKAREFLAGSQGVGEGAGLGAGGFTYGPGPAGKTPDLSNAQFAAAALHDAELPKDSPVWERLRGYLSRVQNRSESNPTVVAAKDEAGADVEVVSGNDGGAGYAPGSGKAGLVKRADGKYEVKSYGSTTYALLKCHLLAGTPADDPRVVAALGWISRHFVLDHNPGFEGSKDPVKAGKQGYYYYLFTMARALAQYEKVTGKPLDVRDESRGAVVHRDWRKELAAVLAAQQKPDGSWVNEAADRWEEGDPVLATSYALQALACCQGRMP